MDSFLAFFGEENLERKMYPMYVVKEEYVVVCVKGLMRLSRVQRERERACARSFSSWTTFFPVAKEQEMVEEAVDDARSVC